MRKRIATVVVVALLGVVGVLTNASPAGATGRAYVAGPSASAVQIDWQTVTKTSSYEALWVQVSVAQPAWKANSCGTGISIWYWDVNWNRRNSYQARDYCTWGPVWSMWTPTLYVKRGTCVQVTYRQDYQWNNGTTFCTS